MCPFWVGATKTVENKNQEQQKNRMRGNQLKKKKVSPWNSEAKFEDSVNIMLTIRLG